METGKRGFGPLSEFGAMTYGCELGSPEAAPGMRFRLPEEGHLFFRGAENGNVGRVFRNGARGRAPPYFSMMSFFESDPVLVSSL